MSINKTTKILLAVKDPVRKAHYLEFLNRYDTMYCVVSSLQEAITHAAEEPHCGLFVDMQLMLRISSSKKADIDDLHNALPSATLNIHGSSGDIRILPRGPKASECSSLDQFIIVCTQFPSKIVYSRKREPIHINCMLDTTPEFNTPYKTVCIDISAGGCFLFCVMDDIVAGSTIWIQMPGSDHESPRKTVQKAVVYWVREWGTTQNIPGIGVHFET